jgi:tRNA threonylcarbamoyladenosine biosynthesis protein TsaB
MLRGHQERLAMLVQAVMAQAGLEFSALDRIAVTVGPGSFTGLRVGLAFAKGLGLALGRPCMGVGTLEALAASDPGDDMTVAAIDARRGQIYLQAFSQGAALMAPDALGVETAAARLAELQPRGGVAIVGSGAALLADIIPSARINLLAAPDPAVVARLGAGRSAASARPLYLRAPDAKLPGGLDPAA